MQVVIFKKAYRAALLLFILFAYGASFGLYAQNISNPQPVVLPISPATSWTVSSGQNITVVSGTSITLKSGSFIPQGATVRFYIDPNLLNIPDPAPEMPPPANLDVNWTEEVSFGPGGAIIGNQRSFFDLNGRLRPLQLEMQPLVINLILYEIQLDIITLLEILINTKAREVPLIGVIAHSLWELKRPPERWDGIIAITIPWNLGWQ